MYLNIFEDRIAIYLKFEERDKAILFFVQFTLYSNTHCMDKPFSISSIVSYGLFIKWGKSMETSKIQFSISSTTLSHLSHTIPTPRLLKTFRHLPQWKLGGISLEVVWGKSI